MRDRLVRSQDGAMVAGVVNALARYFGVDVTLLRIVWVLAIFFNGFGILAYGVAWILIPAEPDGADDRFDSFERLRARVVQGARQVESSFLRREPRTDRVRTVYASGDDRRAQRAVGGAILVLLGLAFLGAEFGWWADVGRLWPLLLIALGVFFVVRDRRGRR